MLLIFNILFFFSFSVLSSGQLQTTFCILDCLAVPPSSITYCSNIVTYTSCLSTRDLTPENADARAANNSASMPRFSDDCHCIEAQKRLLCAQLFPKCNATSAGAIVSQPVCRSTCVQFFARCNVTLTTQCGMTEGIAPSANCTGGGNAISSSSSPSCQPLTRTPSNAAHVTLTVMFQVGLSVSQINAVSSSISLIAATAGASSFNVTLLQRSDPRLVAVRFQGTSASVVANFVADFAWSRPDYFTASDPATPAVYNTSVNPYSAPSGGGVVNVGFAIMIVVLCLFL
jgi:hypothetical protein